MRERFTQTAELPRVLAADKRTHFERQGGGAELSFDAEANSEHHSQENHCQMR